ncbi:MAG: zinc ribbon domain-containing protein [Clostridia bacterium]|nr:zinc ribbon domain-containing protein [Clostridia bacterium]
MFCNKCGANIPDDSAFCPNCGATAVTVPAGTDPNRVVPTVEPYAKTVDPREREASKSVLTYGIIALAFSCTFWLSFVGIIFAFIARSKVKAYESEFGPATGKTKVGKIFSIVSIPLSIALTVFFVLYILFIVGMITFAITHTSKTSSYSWY